MRWQSRLALAAAVVLATFGFAAPVAEGLGSAHRNPGSVERSVSVHRSTETAVVAGEPSGGRPSHSRQPLVGDVPGASSLTPGTGMLLGFLAALALTLRPRLAARSRAPPLRFL